MDLWIKNQAGDLSKQSKREQRINSLYKLAKEKGIKLNG